MSLKKYVCQKCLICYFFGPVYRKCKVIEKQAKQQYEQPINRN